MLKTAHFSLKVAPIRGFVERNDAFNFKYELQRFSQQAKERAQRLQAHTVTS